jgi:hypothetical protein
MACLGQSSFARFALCVLWSAGIITGLYRISAYSGSSGDGGVQPGQWPASSRVRRSNDMPTILVTLHPRCVCSRATLEELSRLLVRIPIPVSVQILMYEPSPATESWSRSRLALTARAIPGVVVHPDPNGNEAARFGMSVSGHTAVYSANGRLLFTGGITPARGHVGDNTGRAAILSLLANEKPDAPRTPVFGCSILDGK